MGALRCGSYSIGDIMAARNTYNFNPTVVGAPTAPWFKSFQTLSSWGSLPPQTTFYLRAFDSGSGGRYVYWSNTGTSPDLSPSATDTTPNTAGSLSLKVIINSVVL